MRRTGLIESRGMGQWAVGGAALAALGCANQSDNAAGCKADNECKGDRVCELGACVDAKAARSAPTPAPAFTADPAASAVKVLTEAWKSRDAEEAAASADAWNQPILKCFHPTAKYVSGTLSPKHRDADGRRAQEGHIEFAGGLTGHGYSLDYVMHSKTEAGDKFFRVTPGKDTAFTQPNPSCSYRDWTRLN